MYNMSEFKAIAGIKNHDTFKKKLIEFDIHPILAPGIKGHRFTDDQVKAFLERSKACTPSHRGMEEIDLRMQIAQLRKDMETLVTVRYLDILERLEKIENSLHP